MQGGGILLSLYWHLSISYQRINLISREINLRILKWLWHNRMRRWVKWRLRYLLINLILTCIFDRIVSLGEHSGLLCWQQHQFRAVLIINCNSSTLCYRTTRALTSKLSSCYMPTVVSTYGSTIHASHLRHLHKSLLSRQQFTSTILIIFGFISHYGWPSPPIMHHGWFWWS